MKQKNLRQAEKTLREMLDRADTGGEGKVDLAEFIKILESNNVQVVILTLHSSQFSKTDSCKLLITGHFELRRLN